jgi:hypothetical protein
MKARLSGTAAIAAVLLASGTAGAEGLAGRISLAAQFGTESQLAGDFLKGAEGTLVGKPITIDSKRYRDVFAPAWRRLQGVLGYGAGERVEVFARGSYYKAEATPLEVGSSNGNKVFAYFGPYEEWGVELGLRYYISTRGRLKSYVAPVAGLRVLERILVDFSVPDAGSAVLNVPFHEAGTVGVFGLDLGFSFDLGEHAFIGIDSGLRYQAKPSPYEGLETLETINASDGRWSAPVVLSLGVRF